MDSVVCCLWDFIPHFFIFCRSIRFVVDDGHIICIFDIDDNKIPAEKVCCSCRRPKARILLQFHRMTQVVLKLNLIEHPNSEDTLYRCTIRATRDRSGSSVDLEEANDLCGGNKAPTNQTVHWIRVTKIHSNNRYRYLRWICMCQLCEQIPLTLHVISCWTAASVVCAHTPSAFTQEIIIHNFRATEWNWLDNVVIAGGVPTLHSAHNTLLSNGKNDHLLSFVSTLNCVLCVWCVRCVLNFVSNDLTVSKMPLCYGRLLYERRTQVWFLVSAAILDDVLGAKTHRLCSVGSEHTVIFTVIEYVNLKDCFYFSFCVCVRAVVVVVVNVLTTTNQHPAKFCRCMHAMNVGVQSGRVADRRWILRQFTFRSQWLIVLSG